MELSSIICQQATQAGNWISQTVGPHLNTAKQAMSNLSAAYLQPAWTQFSAFAATPQGMALIAVVTITTLALIALRLYKNYQEAPKPQGETEEPTPAPSPRAKSPVTLIAESPATPRAKSPVTLIAESPATPRAESPVTLIAESPATPRAKSPVTLIAESPVTPKAARSSRKTNSGKKRITGQRMSLQEFHKQQTAKNLNAYKTWCTNAGKRPSDRTIRAINCGQD